MFLDPRAQDEASGAILVGAGPSSIPAAGTWRARARTFVPPAVLIGALLVVWEVLARLSGIPSWLLPTPTQIAQAMWDSRDLLLTHTRQTLIETWIGLAVSIFAGLVLAFGIDLSSLLRRTLYPLLVTSQTIPTLAIAPLLIIWFGFGILPKVIVVALVCFFPIVVNTADGLRSVDPDFVSLLRSMGASRMQMFFKLRLPAALPLFFSGLKIAVTYAVIGAVIGEWVGAGAGLGIFMLRSSHSFLTDRVFGAIAVTSAVSILMFLMVMLLERMLLKWYFTSSRQEQWEDLTPHP